MRQRRKVRSRDTGKKRKIDQKRPRERKKRSLLKSNHESRESVSKKLKIEEVLDGHQESSSSEEEINEISSLISTFNNNRKTVVSIESSSESDEQETAESESVSDIEDKLVSDENDVAESIRIDAHENESTADEPEEAEIDLEIQNEDNIEDIDDPFVKHLSYDLHESLVQSLQNNPTLFNSDMESWPQIGNLCIQIPKSDLEVRSNHSTFGLLEKKRYAPEGKIPKKILKSKTLQELFIKPQIIKNVNKMETSFSPLVLELFSIINNYQDLCFHQSTVADQEGIRFIYCLHAANHILKTRTRIIHHNAKLSKKEASEEFRDQGLIRPKVLILLPFKHTAYKVVLLLIQLFLPEDKGNVINKTRFVEEYTGNELIFPKKNPKPEDYEQIFQGNTCDDFKMGITVTKKSLKLFADFYSSDIILASPLGLRTVIGAEGEAERDYDFLASIELLIMDQTELFLMQNWDHVLHIFNNMHLQPKDSHGTDFSRVRTWSLNGWSKYYRQTLIFSSLMLPEINAIFNKKCCNYAGKVKAVNPIQMGSIGQVVIQVPHIFQRFDPLNASEAIDKRFDFFITKILPQQRENLMKQTLIFIPSYFDYVRIRNYFKKEDIGFVQICEYTKDAKVARARDMFFHGDVHFLLYTERYHFFNRKRIKGIRHIVFYQPPIFSHFYYEMCNLMQNAYQNRKFEASNMSVTVIYSKYDIHQLSAIVGTEKAVKMCQSDRKVHMMITGKD